MKHQSSGEVAGPENPCIADAAELGGASIASHGDHRKTKPKETEATERASSAEPVEARIAADGGRAAYEAWWAADTKNAFLAEWSSESELSWSQWEAAARAANAHAEAEVRRLREERDLFRTASEAAELRIVELKNELEVEHMRLAGCGVAALGYFEGCADEYKSASLSFILKLRGETETLRAKLARVEAEVAAVRRLRDAASADRDHTVAAAFETAAMYVEDALRDEPQPEPECPAWSDIAGGTPNFCGSCERCERMADEPCDHEWVSYSRPPMRAVTGRQCKRCKVIEEPEREPKLPFNGY